MSQPVGRRLVERQYVRKRSVPKAVELQQHCLQRPRKVATFVARECRERSGGTRRSDPDFVGIPGADRHERGHVRTRVQHADALGPFTRHDVFEQSSAMQMEIRQLLFKLPRRHRRNERIRVDLSVRMMQSDADFHAAVLERIHVSDVRVVSQFLVPVGPDVDQQFEVFEREARRAWYRRPA